MSRQAEQHSPENRPTARLTLQNLSALDMLRIMLIITSCEGGEIFDLMLPV